jgi:hypothetical protein
VSIEADVANLTDFAVLQQEEMISDTIAMLRTFQQMVEAQGHADCAACTYLRKAFPATMEALARVA